MKYPATRLGKRSIQTSSTVQYNKQLYKLQDRIQTEMYHELFSTDRTVLYSTVLYRSSRYHGYCTVTTVQKFCTVQYGTVLYIDSSTALNLYLTP